MPNSPAATQDLTLKVSESTGKDVGRGLARIDPADMSQLGADIGDVVEVVGQKTTVCKLLPAFKEHRGKGRIHIDGIIRENAGAAIDESAVIRRAAAQPAAEVVLEPLGYVPSNRDLEYIGSLLDGLPIVAGDRVRATLFGNRHADFQVKSTVPQGPVVIASDTLLKIGGARKGEAGYPLGATAKAPAISYEDIGGLRRQLERVREIVELPLRYPELFERLGIEAPKGVLLLGPPGCGKTLIARAVAHETEANFFAVNGPEIIHKFYGESEAHLRKIFDEATRKAPSIIFLDEIDAIAPHRDRAVGDVEKRVVAQLLGLMDGLSQRQHVVVLAATNLPNMLDPALRRPGRFDREISIPIPDQHGRQEILEIHSRGMPLAENVKVARLAAITHGFVGADLEALCREAGMNALRRLLPQVDYSQRHIPYELLSQLEVNMENFQEALREVEPSAIREVFVEVPDVGWDDVGGLEEVKQRLREAVEWPMKYAELFRSFHLNPPKGLLLSGPPGCGKTLIAKALASETEVNFIAVKGPELMSMYVGESERGVREIFHKARQAAPCIVFFDEIDAMASTRASGGHQDAGVGGRVLSQLLTELDGIEELKGVLVLAATNRCDLLDPALLRPGRFDLQIELPLPDQAAREKIFQVHLRDRPLATDVTAKWLAEQTQGFSGAEIEGVCHRAMMAVLASRIEASPEQPDATGVEVQREHLQTAIEGLSPQMARVEHE
jgi:transitional endoplasmic reticulum ATPase